MKFVAALSLLLTSVVNGAQDTAYYPGFSNPNTEDEMYYREATNVLQDLEAGEFASLYIKYHTCVWSEYGHGEDNHDDDNGSGCGGDGGDEYWYLGRTQCFRANVAYSLYGVKAGTTAASNPCSQSHYINSFFTTGGIESFGDNVGIAYADYGVSTTCTATYTGNGDDGYNGDDGQNQDGDQDHASLYYPDYNSTTLGCSANGQFIAATFQGAYCDGNHFLRNNGEIEYLNNDLESMGCFPIYGSAAAATDDAGGDDADGDDAYSSGAEALLAYSAACSHTEYPNRCPDPHGIKRARDQRLFNYAQSHYRAVPLIMPIMSTLLLIGSAILYCMANGIRDSAKRRTLESTTGDAQDPSVYEQFSTSMSRVGTDISQRTRTFTEKLAEYAEEEEGDDIEKEGTYQAPATDAAPAEADRVAREPSDVPSVHSVAPSVAKSEVADADAEDTAVAQIEVANAMLADKGVTPKVADVAGKAYKRPRMAKASKWLKGRFGRRKNKNVASA